LPVEVTFQGPRADIVLRRPEVLNAMSFEVFDGLAAAADDVAASDARVAVVSGEGRSFSSGIDVSSLGAVSGATSETIARAQAGFRKIAALAIPTVAAVQGHALGAGLQLALACDLRVVRSDARLGLLESNYGLIPDLGGSTRLPQIVGAGRAKKMIWLAEEVTGAEAAAIGLADVVVAPEGDLAAAVDELVEALLERPSTPVRLAKRLIDRAHLHDHASGMDAEAAAQEECMTDPDFAAALMRGMTARRRS